MKYLILMLALFFISCQSHMTMTLNDTTTCTYSKGMMSFTEDRVYCQNDSINPFKAKSDECIKVWLIAGKWIQYRYYKGDPFTFDSMECAELAEKYTVEMY